MVAVRFHHQRVAGHKSKTPAGHVVRLAHRMQFDADIFCAGRGKERERFALEDQRRVRRVVDDDDVVLLREGDDLGEELRRRRSSGRIVRIVEHQRLGLLQHIRGNAVEIGQEIVLLEQRQIVDGAAQVFRVRAVDRITGRGHQRDVAGIDKAVRQDGQRALVADGMHDFGFRIETADAEDFFHPMRGRLLVLGAAVVGVAAVFGLGGFVSQRLDAHRMRHLIGLTDAHVDQLRRRISGLSGAFGALDLLEFVDGGVFAVTFPTDAFGEEILDVGLGHVGWLRKSWHGADFPCTGNTGASGP